tara:strand:+ start:10265 stop:10870 length:606 start_codon:yes stop_codon:yes gene_type:complete
MKIACEWKCKCNRVIIKFSDYPFMANNCHCNYCFPVAKYLDEEYGTGISAISKKTGVAKAMLTLDKIISFEGKELLKPVKVNQDGKNIRAYTDCCKTLCICDGGVNLDFCFRPFNRNCLYDSETNKPYVNPYLLTWNTQGGDNPNYDNIPEPKDPELPKHLLDIVEKNIKKENYGSFKNDITPGLYCNPTNCNEYVNINLN